MDDKRTTLRRFRLFADVLGPEQLDQLASQSRPCFFRAGSILMSQGDFGSSLYCIVDGLVSVVFCDAFDRENPVATLSGGEVVGEMALLTGDRRTATATALTNVDALEITKPALEKIFAKAPDLVENFAATLAIRQAMLDQIEADHIPIRDNLVKQIRKVFFSVLRTDDRPA